MIIKHEENINFKCPYAHYLPCYMNFLFLENCETYDIRIDDEANCGLKTSVQKAKAAAEAAKKRAAQDKITITKTPSGVKAKAAKKGKVTLTWKKFKQTKKTKAIWKRVKQVEVQYSTDRNFKTGVVSKKLGKKKTKLVVKKLKAKTTYYFRVRYIEGPRKVSKWSAVKKVKAKK